MIDNDIPASGGQNTETNPIDTVKMMSIMVAAYDIHMMQTPGRMPPVWKTEASNIKRSTYVLWIYRTTWETETLTSTNGLPSLKFE